jgi:hypothetical protein
LVSEFGAGTVFRDTDSLLAGRSWKDDILKTVRDCQVVVVHIGENWENLLTDRANSDDFFREEIESALAGKARIIPVITTSSEDSDVHGHMLSIEKKLGNEDLRAKVPRMIEKFKATLQVQRLREDPDFSSDLEQLMRAVWWAFRGPD